MLLQGSCHCGAVKFSVNSPNPYPFNHCYCSVCRKTAGGGGYAINLGAEAKTLEVEGKEHIQVYQCNLKDEAGNSAKSPAERRFCRICGSALWVWDKRWPELLHPFASAIDTPLPKPPETCHMMLDSKKEWVEIKAAPQDRQYSEYPEESLAAWHQRLGLGSVDIS